METNSALGVLFVPPCSWRGCQGYICSLIFLDGIQRPLNVKEGPGMAGEGWIRS